MHIKSQAKIILQAMAILVASFIASGCASYDESWLGGAHARFLSPTLVEIKSSGNAYTNGRNVRDWTLLKAAETALVTGHEYFRIVNKEDRGQTVHIGGNATTHTNLNGTTSGNIYSGTATSTTTYNSHDVYKPAESMTIVLLEEADVNGKDPTIVEARWVINRLAPKHKPELLDLIAEQKSGEVGAALQEPFSPPLSRAGCCKL